MGDIEKMVTADVLEAGAGISILQEINGTVLGTLSSSMLKSWIAPRPTKEQYLVEAAMLEWRKQRRQLRGSDDYSLFKEKLMARIPKMSTPSGNIP